jgi:succinate-acetate transporter protein
MGDSPGWQRIAAVYIALTVVFFAISIGIACVAALLIRIATGREGIHDSIAASGTATAFVIGMWIAGDFIMPRLLNILPTSLVKNIRTSKPDAD